MTDNFKMSGEWIPPDFERNLSGLLIEGYLNDDYQERAYAQQNAIAQRLAGQGRFFRGYLVMMHVEGAVMRVRDFGFIMLFPVATK